MNTQHITLPPKYAKGLTLIEVLAVIAIIGVLAAILIPSGTYVLDKANKVKASSNLRQIILAYTNVLQEEGPAVFNAIDSVHEFAFILASKGKLNDPSLFLIPEDPLIKNNPNEIKSIIGPGNKINDKFASITLSYAFCAPPPQGTCPSTTPIAWTRGLQENGTWENGVYGSQGGFIAFLDGHVVWYKNLTDASNQLFNPHSYTNTSNIYEAIGPQCRVLESK